MSPDIKKYSNKQKKPSKNIWWFLFLIFVVVTLFRHSVPFVFKIELSDNLKNWLVKEV